jgi:hypothetical protein
MAIKVLTGNGYTQARLAGILHEEWVERIGKLVTPKDTLYGHGDIKTNSITGDIGLVVDTTNEYYDLPTIHESRLVDVVDGDGWNEITQ